MTPSIFPIDVAVLHTIAPTTPLPTLEERIWEEVEQAREQARKKAMLAIDPAVRKAQIIANKAAPVPFILEAGMGFDISGYTTGDHLIDTISPFDVAFFKSIVVDPAANWGLRLKAMTHIYERDFLQSYVREIPDDFSRLASFLLKRKVNIGY